jgi:hypothetical protein
VRFQKGETPTLEAVRARLTAGSADPVDSVFGSPSGVGVGRNGPHSWAIIQDPDVIAPRSTISKLRGRSCRSWRRLDHSLLLNKSGAAEQARAQTPRTAPPLGPEDWTFPQIGAGRSSEFCNDPPRLSRNSQPLAVSNVCIAGSTREYKTSPRCVCIEPRCVGMSVLGSVAGSTKIPLGHIVGDLTERSPVKGSPARTPLLNPDPAST